MLFCCRCQGIGDDQGFQMDMWCWRECCEYECPLDKCRCNVNISETDIRSPRDGAITPPTKPNVNASVIGLKDAQMKTLEKLGARARPNVLSDNAQVKTGDDTQEQVKLKKENTILVKTEIKTSRIKKVGKNSVFIPQNLHTTTLATTTTLPTTTPLPTTTLPTTTTLSTTTSSTSTTTSQSTTNVSSTKKLEYRKLNNKEKPVKMIDISKYLTKLEKPKITRIPFRRINIFKPSKSKSPTFGLSSPKIIIFKPKERSIKDDDDKSTRRSNANSAPEIKSPDVPYQIETRETEDIPSKLNSASELIKMTSTSSTTTTTSTTSTTMTAYTTTEISTTTPKTFLSKKKPLKTTNLTSKPRLSFDNPLEITGQDPTGIPLEGLTSSLFGQFFLTKVDLEKELDLQKDVEYTPNKVSNFFNLEDPYQSYQPEVSVSVYTIGESDVTTANPTNNGEMLASSTIPPPIKSTTSFAFTNPPKTTTPEPIRLPSKPTTTTSQPTTTSQLTTTRKPTTTHKPVTTSQLTTTTTHKIITTLKPTTILKPTTTLELSTTRKPAISLKLATTTASKLTTTREPTTTSKPVTRLPRVYSLPTVYQPPIPPPIPPLIRNSNFFSKFSKILGTRKRPMQTATAPSPYKSLQTSSGKINNAVPSTKRTNKSKNTKFIVSKNNTRVKTKVTPTSTTAKSTTIKATTHPTTMKSSTTMATTTSIKPTKSSTTTSSVKPSTTTASTTSRSTTSRVTTTTTQLSPTKATSTTIVSITTKPTTSSTSRQDHGVDDGVDEETVLSPVSIPKVVPYLIFFPDEKTNSQGGYSKQQPSHLDIKKPKIVFEPKKTLLTPKLKPRVDAGQMVDQSKFFGNSSSNINSNSSSNIHQIISVMVKDIISTKIKINDREPTSIPIVTAGNRIKNITEIYGKSSSNFKVSQFNSTVIPKDNGKIYMEEKLPTFEPYTPTNDTNSTNNKMFRDVKNVVHHNFVLDSLIENMANFLKNDESKIQFHLNEDHHDKKANNVLNMKEQIKERIDSSIMSNGDKLDLPAVVSDLNITESIAPQRTQSESQARLDLQNTVFDSNERSKTFERKNKNLNQGKLIRWFNINSKVYRTTPASDTVTEVTSRIQGTTPTSFPVLQTIPPFPTHAIPLRPTSQSTSLKSTLISLLPPPIPSKNLFYHRPGQNPADLPHPTVKVQGTSTQHVISTTKSKTILADKRNPEWPDTPSSFPLSEHYFSLQALKPTDGHTTSASERLTTTTPTTKQTTTKQTTKKQTTTPQLSTVTPIFNMPGLSLGVTTPINKISQLFFPPDFTQKKSLTEIINSDPRIVEGVYTKDVYPPSREQINASDVILSTPYQLKDPVSRVPLFLKSTPSSILTTSSQRPLSEKVHKTRSSSPSLPTIHRVIKLMPSRKRNPTLQPNKGSESAILEKTSENPKPDLTLGSERSSSGIGNSKIQLSPAFTFSNGSALTTNVHRNTKEVRTFRNVGKDILKEIFKSPKVKKHEILSGKVKLPRGKNAVILDIGLLNKLMDTFKQWLTSMRLLVVEK